MVKKALVLFSGIAFLAMFGCASGGNKDVATGNESGKMTAKDEAGFERNVTPAMIHYQSAQQFLSASNYDEAVSQLKTATSLDPNFLDAWAELGRTYMKIKNFQGSIDAYQKALALSPDNVAFLGSLGRAYLQVDNMDKAEEYYAKLIAKDSLSYDGHVSLGFIYLKKNDLDRAIYHYEMAVIAQPDDATSLGTLASLFEKKGNDDKRIEYLKRASVVAPDNYKFKQQLGSAYMKKKDFMNALPVFEELIKQFPDEAAYHQNIGLVLSQMPERRAEAPAELERTLELKGSDPYISGILALVYNELGQHQKAIAAAKRGLEGNPDQQTSLLYYQWGSALSKLESFDEAIAMFEKVVATKDPQWVESARKQIDRQVRLKKIAEQKKQQE
ncbi:MAG: tetratricopeptide repeat protein [Candidatus Krumholzibacteria bacterium]|nr:tetratricopeptide repeat protein [Candidatus Krumholzibacteria bacterium]